LISSRDFSFFELLIKDLFSSSDTNEKLTLDDDDSSPTIATALAALPMNSSKIINPII
jgi:hypothetical protein